MNTGAAELRVIDRRLAAPAAATFSVQQHLLLSTWFSAAFPIGGYAYSHGLETVILGGAVSDGGAVEAWVRALIEHGSGWCDALLLAEAARAIDAGDPQRLADAAELAAAMAPSLERQRETLELGAAFLRAVTAAWPCAALHRLALAEVAPLAYPVALGVAAAGHQLPLSGTIAAYLNSFAAGLISVAVRLVPLGQSAGLKVLAALQPVVLDVAAHAARSTLDDLGSGAMLSDIASMRHETLYSRIFRS